MVGGWWGRGRLNMEYLKASATTRERWAGGKDVM